MKRDSHYKLGKEVKTMMALQKSGSFHGTKNLMIDGEIQGNVVPEKESKKRDTK